MAKTDKTQTIRENRSQALGALALNAGIFIGTKLAISEDYRILKQEISCIVEALGSTEGMGLLLYLAQGELTVAECLEVIDLNGPTHNHSVIEKEKASRYVKLIGIVGDDQAFAVERRFWDAKTGAPAIQVKPRWTFGEVTSWNYLVVNQGVTLTTGATVRIIAEDFGVFLG